MKKCGVKSCKNYTGKENYAKQIKFHNFPKDPVLCKKWIKACNNLKINVEHAGICSVHFSEDCYRLQDKLLNVPMKKRKLVGNAIPTLFLPEEQPRKGNERAQRSEKRKMKKEVRELLIESERSQEEMILAETDMSEECNEFSDQDAVNAGIQTEWDFECTALLEVHELKRQLSEMKRKCIRLEHEKETIKNEVTQLEASIKKIFTPGQIKKWKCPKVRIGWTLQEISSAATLYASGPRAYRLLLKRNYPLPCPTSLRKWAVRSRSSTADSERSVKYCGAIGLQSEGEAVH